jgi:hypothetical protein
VALDLRDSETLTAMVYLILHWDVPNITAEILGESLSYSFTLTVR